MTRRPIRRRCDRCAHPNAPYTLVHYRGELHLCEACWSASSGGLLNPDRIPQRRRPNA